VTPYEVLKASGHVEKFSDFMVKDSKTGDIYRADKLLEEWVDGQLEANPTMAEETKKELLLVRAHADAYNQSELGEVFTKYSIMAPQTGNPLSPPEPFNLSFVLPFVCFFPLFQVFKTSIGPAGDRDAFLRPETAQGIFVNFRRLLEENNSRLPFAAAQIGLSYRNEIAPRDKLLRVREFQQAEIEHFCDFESSEHPKLPFVLDTICSFWTSDAQTSHHEPKRMTIREALESKTLENETLAYYLARTWQFCDSLGFNLEKVRFRQHLDNEMVPFFPPSSHLTLNTSQKGTLRPRLLGSRNQNNIRLG
jgi:glycyl-tRNA synthetase